MGKVGGMTGHQFSLSLMMVPPYLSGYLLIEHNIPHYSTCLRQISWCQHINIHSQDLLFRSLYKEMWRILTPNSNKRTQAPKICQLSGSRAWWLHHELLSSSQFGHTHGRPCHWGNGCKGPHRPEANWKNPHAGRDVLVPGFEMYCVHDYVIQDVLI